MRHNCSVLFFFNDTATTEIYTFPYTTLFRSFETQVASVRVLAYLEGGNRAGAATVATVLLAVALAVIVLLDIIQRRDRKSTRLNSSHANISYAVFCLKKKNIIQHTSTTSNIL